MGSTNRAHLRIMGVLLVGIGVFVYTTPAPPPDGLAAAAAAQHWSRHRRVAGRPRHARRSGSRERAPDTARSPRTRSTVGSNDADRADVLRRASRGRRRRSSASSGAADASTAPTTAPTTARCRAPQCSDFTWQQDAQAAYVANLADPWGLDGPAGPATTTASRARCSRSTRAGRPRPPSSPRPPAAAQARRPARDADGRDSSLAPTDNFFGVSTPAGAVRLEGLPDLRGGGAEAAEHGRVLPGLGPRVPAASR